MGASVSCSLIRPTAVQQQQQQLSRRHSSSSSSKAVFGDDCGFHDFGRG